MLIQYQASFWLRNVSDFSDEYGALEPLSDGLAELSNLLKISYSDFHSYETSTVESIRTKIGIMADDLENYHNLTEILDCLYKIAVVDTLQKESGVSYLTVNKAELKKEFKGSPAYPFQMLEKYRFYFKFLKGGKEANSYRSCDTFYLFYDNENTFMTALKYLVERLPKTTAKEDYLPEKYLLYIADFDSILLENSTKQTDINPLKSCIVRTAGEKKNYG